MKRALALLLLAGCFDFGRALEKCRTEGRCPDGGATGGGASGGPDGGGTGTGGGTAGGAGGGASAGAASFCTDAGICFELPQPTGNDWGQVWAASPTDVWGVGNLGLLAHWDGARFTEIDPRSIIGRNGNPLGGLWYVWGLASNDVWATGAEHPLLHWDGARWSTVRVGLTLPDEAHSCWGVHGARTDEVWVSCEQKLYRGSATGVSEVVSDAGDLECGLLLDDGDGGGVTCAHTPQNGGNRTVLHIARDGAATDVTPAPGGAVLTATARLRTGEGWLGGVGTGPYLAREVAPNVWQQQPVPAGCDYQVNGLADDGDGGLLVACLNGQISRIDGQAFRAPNLEESGLQSLATAGSFAVAAGIAGQFSVAERGVWRDVVTGDGRDFYAAQLFDGVLYAVGERSLFMQRDRDGGWSYPFGRPGVGMGGIDAIAVSDAGFWIGHAGKVRKRTGAGGWTDELITAAAVNGLEAIGPEVWAVNAAGVIERRPSGGSTWQVERDGGGELVAIWGSAPNRLFAVGKSGLALVRDTVLGWSAVPVSTGAADLVDVGGLEQGPVYALAADGTVLEYDGGFSPVGALRSACTEPKNRLAVAPNGDVWISGHSELCVLRSGAPQLESFLLPTIRETRALVVDDAVYSLHAYGVVLRAPK